MLNVFCAFLAWWACCQVKHQGFWLGPQVYLLLVLPEPAGNLSQSRPEFLYFLTVAMASQEGPPQKLSDAALRLRDASKMRYTMLRDQAGMVWGQARTRAPTYWEEYKPRTLLQWTVSDSIGSGPW
jgi:hypothetical protein